MKSQDIEDLCMAAMSGEADKAAAFLKAGVPVDSVNRWGRSPLMGAAAYAYLEIIDLLLDHGADPNLRSPGDEKDANLGRTALIEAIESRMISEEERLQVVRKLLVAGAGPNVPDVRGRAPLHHAAALGQPDVVRHLLEAGADLDARDVFGYTALMHASDALRRKEGEASDALRILREAGAADEGVINIELAWAAAEKEIEAVKSALDNGADVNFLDKHGDTPLRGATVSRSRDPDLALDTMKVLLSRGADPDRCRDGQGTPPIFNAIDSGDLEAVKLLVENGADLSREWDRRGVTPLGYARALRKTEVLEYLKTVGATASSRARERGLGNRDGDFSAVLLNRGIDEVTAALAGEGEALRAIQGKPVDCGKKALLIYQLKGHGWTAVEPAAGFTVSLRRAEELSRSLGCQTIHLGVSDTAEMVQYTLFEAGERTEWLYWGPKRGATPLETFTSEEWEWDFGSQSKKRKPSRKTDPREILHRFLKSQDAYYMGPASRGDGGTQTFFEGWSSRELVRADVVRLGAP